MYVNPLIGIKNNEKCIRFLRGDVMRKVEIGHCQKCLPCSWPSEVIIKESGLFSVKGEWYPLNTKKSYVNKK